MKKILLLCIYCAIQNISSHAQIGYYAYITSSQFRFNAPPFDNYKLDTICAGDTVTMLWVLGSLSLLDPNVTYDWSQLKSRYRIIGPDDKIKVVFVVDSVVSHNWFNLVPPFVDWTVAFQSSREYLRILFPVVSKACGSRSLFSTDKSGLCVGDCVEWRSESKYVPTSWEWRFEGGSPSSFIGESPPPVCYRTSGEYGVRLITSNATGGDTLSRLSYIKVSSYPSGDSASTAVSSGYNEPLSLRPCVIAQHYNWYNSSGDSLLCSDCKVFTQSYLQSQTILCESYNENESCSKSCRYTISVPEVAEEWYLPNSFSPNDDGINDYLEAYHNPEVEVSSMQIYDRWGGLRYESRSDAPRWDGRSNHDGHLMEVGVYVCVIRYKNRRTGEEKVKASDVSLLR